MAAGFFDDSAAKKLKAAAAQGKPIGVIKVSEEISLKAVLLPPAVVDRAFGKEIRNNYAVVHLTVSNKSRDAAFILHHVFLDYSSWFSAPGVASDDFDLAESVNASFTKRRQLGSVEARIVRAELQEAQNWTWRNLLVRGLKVTGSIAAAYTFATTSPSVAKGIASFNGNVVPGVELLFPDPLIGQINRISDYGFRTPTVIPREDGTVIVAFFPLDRILTPALKEAFLKSPAIFFNPELVAIDPKAQTLIGPLIQPFFEQGMKQLKQSVKAYEDALADPTKAAQLNAQALQSFIKFMRSLSLDNVRLGVEGVMVVDVKNAPASISGVEWGGNGSDFWLTPGKKTGKLTGRLLSGGEVKIKDAVALGIKSVKTVSVSQDGRTIDFEIELASAIESGAKLGSEPGTWVTE
jgi:hypothetical protein